MHFGRQEQSAGNLQVMQYLQLARSQSMRSFNTAEVEAVCAQSTGVQCRH